MKVEVVYGTKEHQELIELDVPVSTRLMDAVKQSGILERFPEIDLSSAKMGVFGRIEGPDYRLQEWDRVEIYRPLLMDPKEARRQRAKQ